MALPPLLVVLQADIASFQSKMGIVKGEMAGVEGAGNKAFSGLSSLGKVAFLGVGAAAIGGSALALKMGADFQSAITQLITGAGEFESNRELVTQGILKMAGEVGTSTTELAKGMYLIDSAGYKGADGLKVLQAAAEGAKTGNADLATVANAVTSAMNAYKMPVGDAAKVTSELIATVAAGKIHLEDLSGALGAILPVASALHVPFEQATGAIATMSMQGTDAATSTQSLRFLMSALAGPTSAAAKELHGLGLGATEANGFSQAAAKSISDLGLHSSAVAATLAGPTGLQGALKMITDALAKQYPLYQTNAGQAAAYEAALKGAVGGTRGLTAALELTGTHQATFLANTKSISGATVEAGGHVRGWAAIQHDFNQRVSEGVEGTKAWVTQVGMALIPVAEKAMDTVAAWSGWLGKHMDIVKAVAVAVGSVLVFAIGMYTVSMIAAAAATIAATWELMLVIGVIAGVAYGLSLAYQHSKSFHDAVNAIAGFVGGVLIPILGTLIGSYIKVLVVGFTDAAAGVNVLWNAFLGFIGWVSSTLKPALAGISATFKAVGDAMNAINPFAKHSPSLVENVAAGVEAIKGHYMSVSGMRLSAPSIGGMTAGAGGLSGIPTGGAFGGGSNAGGVTVNVTVQGNVLNWNDTAQQLAEPIRAALLQKKRSLGTLGLA